MYKVAESLHKIAFGGGCHWCTEAVFQSLKGVEKVEQGFIASTGINDTFSEAVIVHFEAAFISQKVLIEIHLHTHNSTSYHSMRHKYRSAIYTYSKKQAIESRQCLVDLQSEFDNRLITKVYPFAKFKPSEERFINYYGKNPSKPFCKNHIDPKLRLLLSRFAEQVNVKN
ncbi:peptide-methionine (S)-S-oxide reductase [uncultured Kriegella sp.]|uniref:peptide-methionine (S)-S-oxide reductase n=1 Tax=uncultured Kriegella sp. TaxID=1798910 RepID=UPI0030DD04A5|tara:strand:- start:23491 stop:24000 length:510 start_codon:yes stop_codon:yes gene_type:complete